MRDGFGGMMAFDVGEDQEDAKQFIRKRKLIFHAVILVATETLVCIPYLTAMLYLPPERRTVFGIKENTVRLSLGIEPTASILEDLEQALSGL